MDRGFRKCGNWHCGRAYDASSIVEWEDVGAE